MTAPTAEQFLQPDPWKDVRRFLQELLGGDILGIAYAQRIALVLDQWHEPPDTELSIAVLPRLTCQANGGDPALAAPILAAWRLLRLAVKLFDDVEDGDIRFQPAEWINIATGLLSLSPLLLGLEDGQALGVEQRQQLGQQLHRAVVQACAGQHADLTVQTPAVDPERWLAIARAKSGAFLGWAAWAGAYVAGAPVQSLTSYHAYGSHLGVLLQVADDFNGVWHAGAASDLTTGHLSLPVCYALEVAPSAERERLVGLLGQAAQGDMEAEALARQCLTEFGAQVYMLVVAHTLQQQALAALAQVDGVPEPLEQLATLLERPLPALRSTGD